MKQAVPRATDSLATPPGPVQKAPALDMASVATTAPKENPRSDPPTRIFGLQDAPCYYPTAKEWMDPLKFIERIRPDAEKAGICKIVPPEGWKPPFCLDSEVKEGSSSSSSLFFIRCCPNFFCVCVYVLAMRISKRHVVTTLLPLSQYEVG